MLVATPTTDPRFAAMVLNPPPAEICGKFGADTTRSATTITLGTPVQIYWNPAKNAAVYKVVVYGPDNTVVGEQRTTDTSLTLRPSLFSGYNQPYAWIVTALDANDVPLCLPRGSEFRTAAH